MSFRGKLTSRLGRNVLALSVLQIMNYAVPLVTVPYLTRVLGPERFGLMAFAQAVIVYFDLITDYGFNLSATRKIASALGDRTEVSRIFWSTLVTKVCLMVACALVLGLALETIPALRHEALLYSASFLTVVGTAFFPVWFFQGTEQLKFVTMGQSTARLLSLPVMFLCVKQSGDYALAALIQGSVPVLAALIVAPAIWKQIRMYSSWPSMRDIHSCLRDGWHLFVSNTAMYLFSSTTVVLLGLVAGNAQVGYYSAADKLIRAGNALMNPITQALYPHLNSLRVTSEQATLRLIRKSLTLVGCTTLVASIGTFLLAGPISHLLLGNRFGPSVAVLQCMCPLLFLLGVSNILGTQTMLVFGLDSLVSRIILLSAIVSGVSTVLLASRWGAPGAAVATTGSALLMMLLMIAALRRARLAVWREVREAAAVG